MFRKFNQVTGKGFAVHSLRRPRLEIVADVLFCCRRAEAKTKIMRTNNLSYNQLEEVLPLLTSSGLLRKESEKYVTTDKGISFIEQFKSISSLLTSANYTIENNLRMLER
jgi:predicted transcriptional regulator